MRHIPWEARFSVCEGSADHAQYLSVLCTDWFDCCHLGVDSAKVRANAFKIPTPRGGKTIVVPRQEPDPT